MIYEKPTDALHAPDLAAADQCTTMFFFVFFWNGRFILLCDTPADALQANDISRSDFMRRKVFVLVGKLYKYYTNAR